MSTTLARSLVFTAAATTLILEIIAVRLLAPFLGLTIETFTAIIGVVLAGIAVGAWAGGRLADRVAPRTLLGPLFATAGTFTLFTPTIVQWIGPAATGSGAAGTVLASLVPFFVPAALLSAVAPVVVKVRLASLEETGTVVGSLSAMGTAGALFGSFLTGFVLVGRFPGRWIVFGVGILLIAIGVALTVRRTETLSAIALPAALAALLIVVVDGPCEVETPYSCAFVTVDPVRPTGRTLWLDDARHSYVDLADDTHLEFRYAAIVGDVLDVLPDGPIDVVYIGGGAYTFPRYVSATRPGSTGVVLEIDPDVGDLIDQSLGGRTIAGVTTVAGDARLTLPSLADGSFDAVVGDAFGGHVVPWHLTTQEYVEAIEELLRPGGLYVLNLIDHPPLTFARAEVATIASVFDHVLLIAPESYLVGGDGGNFVVVASQREVPAGVIRSALRARSSSESVAADVSAFVGDARVLTDDFAPVDQMVTRR